MVLLVAAIAIYIARDPNNKVLALVVMHGRALALHLALLLISVMWKRMTRHRCTCRNSRCCDSISLDKIQMV